MITWAKMKWYCIIHYVWFVQNIFLLCPYIVWFRHFLLMWLYLAIIISNNVYVCKGYCLASVSTIYRLDFRTSLYFFVGFMFHVAQSNVLLITLFLFFSILFWPLSCLSLFYLRLLSSPRYFQTFVSIWYSLLYLLH
jgi:hypothetical protein